MTKLPPASPPVKPSLTSAAAEIAALHGQIITAARSTLDNAIRIGELLHAQKAALKHGEWLPWIEKNLPFDRMTAARYMRVFDRREEIKCNSVLHLTDAYRLLAESGQAELPPPGPAPRADVLRPNSPCIPPPGVFRRTHCRAGLGWLTIYVSPSVHADFFFVNVFFSDREAERMGGSLDGTMKAVHKSAIEHLVSRHTPAAGLQWEELGEIEPWKYNEFLFDSYEEYVDQAILGKTPAWRSAA
jgi:hypothetical protein